MRPQAAVTFLPSGSTVWVQPGTTVLEAARSAGVTIVAPCGGRGVCGACGIQVIEGVLSPADEAELAGLVRAPAKTRLACRARVAGAVTVRPILATAPHRTTSAELCARVVSVGVDLGTTNVSALAVEADGGREVGRSAVPNGQQSWGADVLSRASAALSGESEVLGLQRAAAVSITEVIAEATHGAEIARIVIAGNSVMTGLLAGSDLKEAVRAPFPAPEIPANVDISLFDDRAREWPVPIVVPPVASFVGGDVLAGAVHTGILYADAPALLVDIGTNAEVMLAARGDLWVTSAPAGPAFEGVGVACGGPAAEGAVMALTISAQGVVDLETIGGEEGRWFSGAGLLSALAALRRFGAIGADGLITPNESRLLVESGEDGVKRLCLWPEGGLQLNQLDIRAVQLAKAAVRVGIEVVLRTAGVPASELSDFYVAGAFGAALPVADLVELGVVPLSAQAAVRYVGNASLKGATAMAIDPAVLEDAATRAGAARHVELAADPGFAEALMRATDLEGFDI